MAVDISWHISRRDVGLGDLSLIPLLTYSLSLVLYRLSHRLINRHMTRESGAAAGFKHVVKHGSTGNCSVEEKYTQTLPHIVV